MEFFVVIAYFCTKSYTERTTISKAQNIKASLEMYYYFFIKNPVKFLNKNKMKNNDNTEETMKILLVSNEENFISHYKRFIT